MRGWSELTERQQIRFGMRLMLVWGVVLGVLVPHWWTVAIVAGVMAVATWRDLRRERRQYEGIR